MRVMYILRYLCIFLIIIFMINVSILCASNDKKNSKKPKFEEFEEERVIGEYIVTVKEGIDEEFLYKLFSANAVLKVKKIHQNIFLVELENDPGPTEVYKLYLEDEDIENIQPNYKYHIEPPERKEIKLKE